MYSSSSLTRPARQPSRTAALPEFDFMTSDFLIVAHPPTPVERAGNPVRVQRGLQDLLALVDAQRGEAGQLRQQFLGRLADALLAEDRQPLAELARLADLLGEIVIRHAGELAYLLAPARRSPSR